MDKARELFLKCSRDIVYILFMLIILYLFIMSLFNSCTIAYTDEHTFFIKDFPQFLAPGLLFLLFLLFWIKSYVNNRIRKWRGAGRGQKLCKRILFGITMLWFLLLLWWVIKAPAIPMGDQYSVFTLAKEFLSGNYVGWKAGNYMHMYPYQNTMVLFYAAFHFLFGENALLAVKLFNLVCWYACILAICKLIEKCFGKEIARWTYLALLLFFPVWSYVTYIYGTVPGMCFAIWGVFLEKKFEETGKNKYLIVTGVLLLLAVMWKSNYIIFIIAVIIMLMIHAVRERGIKSILGILWIGAAYLVGIKGALFFVAAVTGEDTGSGILFIGGVIDGLKESVMAPGWYSAYAELLYAKYHGDASAMMPQAIQDLKDTLAVFAAQPEYALRFFSRKIASMWSAPFLECTTLITKANSRSDMEGFFENLLCDGQPLNILLLLGLDVAQSILYFGILLFLIFDRKKLDLKKAGFIICFLGGFLFYFFWEAKCQYILPYYLLLFPYSVEGFKIMLECFTNIQECRKDKAQDGKIERLAILWNDVGIRLLAAVFVLIVIIAILPESITDSVIKLGKDTTDYIWFCQNNV